NLLIRSQMLYSVELRSHHCANFMKSLSISFATAKLISFLVVTKFFHDFFTINHLRWLQSVESQYLFVSGCVGFGAGYRCGVAAK
ncbi:hypothetical protein, partial [Paramuribaculum intestinale]|uniref:hypothetical protein n=5 Tax=Paramuribaculum intestinale TaxID=2094151 RepID=UPI0025B709F1